MFLKDPGAVAMRTTSRAQDYRQGNQSVSNRGGPDEVRGAQTMVLTVKS